MEETYIHDLRKYDKVVVNLEFERTGLPLVTPIRVMKWFCFSLFIRTCRFYRVLVSRLLRLFFGNVSYWVRSGRSPKSRSCRRLDVDWGVRFSSGREGLAVAIALHEFAYVVNETVASCCALDALYIV